MGEVAAVEAGSARVHNRQEGVGQEGGDQGGHDISHVRGPQNGCHATVVLSTYRIIMTIRP